MAPSQEKQNNNKSENPSQETSVLENAWSIRPCSAYEDEYDDCTSIKARFHQYFINGENKDCSQWKIDFENCKRYEKSNGNDTEAGMAIIKSEEERQEKRMKAHYGNTTWEKRRNPPTDWSAPLPDWMEKRNENTYLQIKQNELEGRSPASKDEKSYCVVM